MDASHNAGLNLPVSFFFVPASGIQPQLKMLSNSLTIRHRNLVSPRLWRGYLLTPDVQTRLESGSPRHEERFPQC